MVLPHQIFMIEKKGNRRKLYSVNNIQSNPCGGGNGGSYCSSASLLVGSC